MNVNDLKPPHHNKAMRMWRGAGILMGNLVVITCIYGFFLFNNLSFLIIYFVLRYKYHVIKY